MYTLPTTNYLLRNLAMNNRQVPQPKAVVQPNPSHQDRLIEELLDAGLVKVELKSSESRYLLKSDLIHSKEHIGGVVYGHAPEGMVMLIATDKRVIYLDKKPLFVNKDDITFVVVSGVSYSHTMYGTKVTLHTKIKDYSLTTLNKKSALTFVKFIENRCLEHTKAELLL